MHNLLIINIANAGEYFDADAGEWYSNDWFIWILLGIIFYAIFKDK
jgi:hypothetical protein